MRSWLSALQRGSSLEPQKVCSKCFVFYFLLHEVTEKDGKISQQGERKNTGFFFAQKKVLFFSPYILFLVLSLPRIFPVYFDYVSFLENLFFNYVLVLWNH